MVLLLPFLTTMILQPCSFEWEITESTVKTSLQCGTYLPCIPKLLEIHHCFSKIPRYSLIASNGSFRHRPVIHSSAAGKVDECLFKTFNLEEPSKISFLVVPCTKGFFFQEKLTVNSPTPCTKSEPQILLWHICMLTFKNMKNPFNFSALGHLGPPKTNLEFFETVELVFSHKSRFSLST